MQTIRIFDGPRLVATATPSPVESGLFVDWSRIGGSRSSWASDLAALKRQCRGFRVVEDMPPIAPVGSDSAMVWGMAE